MYLYVSDPSGIAQLLTYSQAQTGNIDASTSDVYLGGSSFQGVVAECMIWGRALSAQEVQELFFRPLIEVSGVSKPPPLTPPPLTGNYIGLTVVSTNQPAASALLH